MGSNPAKRTTLSPPLCRPHGAESGPSILPSIVYHECPAHRNVYRFAARPLAAIFSLYKIKTQ